MLNASIYIVFALLLIVCSLLLLVVLMQRPKQEGLGAAFGAQTDQAFGAQTTDVLKKGTVFFGSLFMILCFVLALLMNMRFQQQKSELGREGATPAVIPAVATETPADAPAAPAAPAVENLENLVTPAPAEQPAPAPQN